MAEPQQEPISASSKPTEGEAGESSLNTTRTEEAEPSTSSSTPASSSTSPETATLTQACAACSKPPPTSADGEPQQPHKPCAKCQTTRYCSRACQKTDAKQHKKVCAALAQAHALSGAQRPVVSSAASRASKPPRQGGLQKWQFDT